MNLKSTLIKGLLSLGLVAGFATSANAYSVETQPQFHNAGFHEVTLDDGMYFRFYVPETPFTDEAGNVTIEFGEVALVGIQNYPGLKKIELPSEITFTSYYDNSITVTKTVTKFGSLDAGRYAYWCEDSYIEVPECYTSIAYILNGEVPNIILKSSVPPVLQRVEGVWTNFIVSKEYEEIYKEYIANDINGWGGMNCRSIYGETKVINSITNTLLDLLVEASNGDVESISSLKITGEINGRDMNAFSNLPYLTYLDLSEVTVVASDRNDQYFTGCRDLTFLEKVILPPSITTLDSEAFANCFSLSDINLENIQSFGSVALYYCSLTSTDLSSAKNIGSFCFEYNRKLKEVILSDNLNRIDSYGFANTGLETIEIPKNAYLSNNIFDGTKIKEIKYYKGYNISGSAWDGMNYLESVYCYDPMPYNNKINLSANVDLYVPAFALEAFKNNNNYNNYQHIYELEDGVDNLEITSDYEINTTRGLAIGFDLNIAEHSNFTNNSKEELKIGNFTQNARYLISTNYEQDNGFNTRSSSFISRANAEAQNVTVNLKLINSAHWNGSGAWNFISFPYNVNVNEILPPENALWAIREYDGKERADNPSNGISKWINKTNGILEAGKGYIIHFASDKYEENIWGNGYDYAFNTFTFPAADDETKNNIFAYDDVTKTLNFFDSEMDHNKSWNLIGNPFDSYYDINGIEYSNVDGVSRVPITVWRRISNNYTYEAFSADDDFILLPFEAFFVQAIDENNLDMVFKADGRMTNTINPRSLTRAADPVEGTQRSIFNFNLSSENGGDRTRLVINNNASEGYEIACDASKFMAPDLETPQIFMLEGNEKFAINERPFGAGKYRMGVRIGATGTYTIALDTRNAYDYEVRLIDNVNGKQVVLSDEDYTFDATTGDDDRFIVELTDVRSIGGDKDTTAIDEVNAYKPVVAINGNILSVEAEGEINVYGIDGKVVASAFDNLSAVLASGVYVVKAGNETVKVVIR